MCYVVVLRAELELDLSFLGISGATLLLLPPRFVKPPLCCVWSIIGGLLQLVTGGFFLPPNLD